jgi:hypothetical protein
VDGRICCVRRTRAVVARCFALFVEQPPQEHGKMHEIQQSTDGCRDGRRRRIGGSDDDLLEYSLYAQS